MPCFAWGFFMALYCTLHEILLGLPCCLLVFNLSRNSATRIPTLVLGAECDCSGLGLQLQMRKKMAWTSVW